MCVYICMYIYVYILPQEFITHKHMKGVETLTRTPNPRVPRNVSEHYVYSFTCMI